MARAAGGPARAGSQWRAGRREGGGAGGAAARAAAPPGEARAWRPSRAAAPGGRGQSGALGWGERLGAERDVPPVPPRAPECRPSLCTAPGYGHAEPVPRPALLRAGGGNTALGAAALRVARSVPKPKARGGARSPLLPQNKINVRDGELLGPAELILHSTPPGPFLSPFSSLCMFKPT